jgi:hypothetical protein
MGFRVQRFRGSGFKGSKDEILHLAQASVPPGPLSLEFMKIDRMPSIFN